MPERDPARPVLIRRSAIDSIEPQKFVHPLNAQAIRWTQERDLATKDRITLLEHERDLVNAGFTRRPQELPPYPVPTTNIVSWWRRRINGLGMQAHWNVGFSENDIRTTLDLYKTLGVDLQLTELDLSVYKSDTDASSTVYTAAFSESQELAYPKLFKIIADYKSYITGVTFWGVADDYTWLDKSDRKAFPFLLNTNHQPKKAYGAVQKMIKAL